MVNRKIKILYEIHPNIIGGIERFLFNLIKYLNREKFEPIIFSWIKGKTINMFKALNVEIKIIDTRYPKRPDALVSFLRKPKIDIAQSNYFWIELAMAAIVASIPHIWMVEGDIHSALSDLKLQQRQYLLNIISALSKKIVCPSEFLKRRFKNVKTPKTKIIYNGVDFDKIDSTYPDYTLLRKYDCDNNWFAIGMVACLMPQKRHIDFIRAAKIVKKYIPNTKFLIFGTTYPSKKSLNYAKYLHNTVKEIGMDKDIIFAGFYKDILKAIKSMYLIVLPSIDEGSSNAIREAMALGKPLIASDSGANRELIKNRVTGYLIPPKNHIKLAERIIYLLKNPKKAKAMGDAGRKRAKRLFDIKRIVPQYEQLYQEVYNKSIKP